MKIANKKVALTPSTFEALSNIRPPGMSLDDTVADLIIEHQKRKLERDLDEIDENGQFIPWDKAKKEHMLVHRAVTAEVNEMKARKTSTHSFDEIKKVLKT